MFNRVNYLLYIHALLSCCLGFILEYFVIMYNLFLTSEFDQFEKIDSIETEFVYKYLYCQIWYNQKLYSIRQQRSRYVCEHIYRLHTVDTQPLFLIISVSEEIGQNFFYFHQACRRN